MSDVVFYIIGSLVVVASIACWLINLFTLPGNWGIPILAIGMAWFFPTDSLPDGSATPGVGWIAVGVLVGLAILGEILEGGGFNERKVVEMPLGGPIEIRTLEIDVVVEGNEPTYDEVNPILDDMTYEQVRQIGAHNGIRIRPLAKSEEETKGEHGRDRA